MKAILLALALFCGLGVSCYSPVTYLPTITVEQEEVDFHYMADRTMLISAQTGTGSGVVFLGLDGQQYVLTAAHVVSHEDVDANGEVLNVPDEAKAIKFFGPLPWESSLTMVKIDYKLDLAILRLGNAWPYSASFTDDVRVFQKCYVSGHPLGVADTTVTEGRIQDRHHDGFIRYSAPSVFGNSGGPVFVKDADGTYKVFSICQRVFVIGFGSPVTHMGLGALPEVISEFVKGL